MLYFLFFVICLLGVVFHRSKVIRALVVLYVFALMAFNYQNPDTHSYVLIYENPARAQEEVGFRFICSIFNKLGFSYDVFHFIIVAVGLTFLIVGIVRISGGFSRHIGYVMALYMLCPMMNDVILIRSFLAGCIAIYAISYLIKQERVKYTIWIIIASTIHVSALIYLLFMVSNRQKYSKKVKWLLGLLIISNYVMLETSFLQNVLLRFGVVNTTKIMLWLDVTAVSSRAYLYSITFHFLNYVLFMLIRKLMIKYCPNRDTGIIGMENVLLSINNMLLLNIVFTALSDQFMRVLWVGMVINTIYYAKSLFYVRRVDGRVLIKSISLIMPFIMFAYRMFLYTTPNGTLYFDYIFKAIIDNNYLLN